MAKKVLVTVRQMAHVVLTVPDCTDPVEYAQEIREDKLYVWGEIMDSLVSWYEPEIDACEVFDFSHPDWGYIGDEEDEEDEEDEQ